MVHAREASVRGALDVIIPITRFNRGEANKIFEEVSTNGTKIVLKNNDPVCVLVEPVRYAEMLDKLEEYELLVEAFRREEVSTGNAISHKNLMAEFGITKEDLDDIEVEIE